jgi:polysaccharide export outer membrane protein
MMKNFKYLFLILPFLLTSCITTKDVRYLQPSESLVINEEGLVPYNIPVYRITKNDILNLNIVTTPKGDAAQFYSSYNTQEEWWWRSCSIRRKGGGQFQLEEISISILMD